MFLSLKKPYPIKIIQYIKLKNTDTNLLINKNKTKY